MKKYLFAGLTTALIATLCGCSEGPVLTGNDASGTISPVVTYDASVLSASGSETRGALSDLSADDLQITLTKADGSQTFTYNSISEFPTDRDFPTGDYILSASYGDESQEGFELPYIYGETPLTVYENKTTTVSLSAKLANAMVNVIYTDNFKNYFENYSATVTTLKATHYFAADEERMLSVQPGTVTPAVTYTTPAGSRKTVNGVAFSAKAQTLYNVTFDLSSESGKTLLLITYDDGVEVENVPFDLSDDIENAPAPTAVAAGFEQGTPVAFVEKMYGGGTVKMNLIARAGLSSVIMETSSESLRKQGFPESIELIGASAGEQAQLTAMGISTMGLWKNPDQMAVVDLTGILSKIDFVEGGNNESKFTITVTDRLNRTSEPLTLDVAVEKAEFSIEAGEDVNIFDDKAVLNLNFNGPEPEKYLKIQVKNNRGTWSDANATIEPVSRSTETYRATITVPRDDKDILARVALGNRVSDVLTIERKFSDATFEINENMIFATRASFACSDASLSGTYTCLLTENGENYEEVTAVATDGILTLESLKPGTTYKLFVKINGLTTRPCSFTTEDATPIPGGDFDDGATTSRSGSNWETYVFPNGWGTNNAMTTSEGADYAYVRISGTKPTSDAHSKNAVQLRTNGWGSGNSSTGSWTGFMKSACKYADPGLLHLGADRTTRPAGYTGIAGPLTTDDLECGVPFTSRPSSISFWYKYEAKNQNDHGEALVTVRDAEGNTIASATMNLGSQDEYKKVTLPLTYAAGAPKAATIYVRFLSTNVQDSMQKNASWLTPSPFANLSRGEHQGSTLFIDDVTANY